jgi:2-hydroxy-3-keto-5-methylthiopentenyl-1-phosphate phosphatase
MHKRDWKISMSAKSNSTDTWDPTLNSHVILCDFDGTITPLDAYVVLLEKFGHPDHRRFQTAFDNEEIGTREYVERTFPLLEAPLEALNASHDSLPIDPTFHVLYDYCAQQKLDLWIASDGFDWWIDRILKNFGFEDIPVLSNSVTFTKAGPRFIYPWRDERCPVCKGLYAVCKNRIIQMLRRITETVIFVGDGKSDFCSVGVADKVLAKGKLARYCDQTGQEYDLYEDFNDVVRIISEFISR